MEHDRNAAPFNPLPPVVWAMVLGLLGIELLLQAGAHGLIGGPEAVGWRQSLIHRFGFSGAIWEWMVETRRFGVENLLRFVTYPLLHGGLVHVGFVAVLLLALGKAVGEALRGWAVLAVALAGSAAGALVYASLRPEATWLFGGYPAVFALVGAYSVLLWTEAEGQGGRRLRAFGLVATLLAIRIALGLWVGVSSDWIADIAAFATGFGLAFLLVPGGWRRLLARLRAR